MAGRSKLIVPTKPIPIGAAEQNSYRVDWRQLRACDYGAPTIRKRLFLVARCDRNPINSSNPTHRDPDGLEVSAGILKGTGMSFCVDAHQLHQLIGAVGDVEFTGSSPDASFIAHPNNPNTIVIQMPMKISNG